MNVQTNDVALITGASAGIGAEFARQLARRGARVVLVARSAERLEAVAAEARQAGGEALVVPLDLASEGCEERLAQAVAARGWSVDLLINNAGFGTYGVFSELDAKRERQEIALNVQALVGLTHQFLPGMRQRNRGGVINVASTASFQPVPYMAVYAATKAFVLSFSEALSAELRGSAIHVVTLCPGPTETEFFQALGSGSTPRLGPRRTAAQVVETGLQALQARRSLAIDGWSNRLVSWSPRFAPRSLVKVLASWMMRPKR